MKLRNLFVCASLFLPVAAFAGGKKNKSLHDQFTGQGYGTAGCGLGSVVFGDKPGMVQIFAATTNNIGGNQTFAISSGTSNCEPKNSSHSALRVKVNQYVAGNRNQLQNDIAKAGGPTLAALEQMGSCGSLGADMQKSYGEIFADDRNEIVSDKIYSIMASPSKCRI